MYSTTPGAGCMNSDLEARSHHSGGVPEPPYQNHLPKRKGVSWTTGMWKVASMAT